MEELMKINAKIKKQQIGKLIAAGVCACCGIGLLVSYSYQKGITACQKSIAKFYPDEYESLTAKVIETFERDGTTKF